jgi:hypothetical protein
MNVIVNDLTKPKVFELNKYLMLLAFLNSDKLHKTVCNTAGGRWLSQYWLAVC